MGRRPIGQQAMTDAERMRRYRANRRAAEPAAEPEPDRRDAEITELRKRLADVEAHRDRLFAERLSIRFGPKPRAAKPKVEKPPLPPDEVRDKKIEALQTQVRNLRGNLRAVSDALDEARQNQHLPDDLRRRLLSFVHPERFPGDPEMQRLATTLAQDLNQYFGGRRKGR
jgi:hypothetical protein